MKALMVRRRHRPVNVGGYPEHQRCTICGAERDMWGGKALTSLSLKGVIAPWCNETEAVRRATG